MRCKVIKGTVYAGREVYKVGQVLELDTKEASRVEGLGVVSLMVEEPVSVVVKDEVVEEEPSPVVIEKIKKVKGKRGKRK